MKKVLKCCGVVMTLFFLTAAGKAVIVEEFEEVPKKNDISLPNNFQLENSETTLTCTWKVKQDIERSVLLYTLWPLEQRRTGNFYEESVITFSKEKSTFYAHIKLWEEEKEEKSAPLLDFKQYSLLDKAFQSSVLTLNYKFDPTKNCLNRDLKGYISEFKTHYDLYFKPNSFSAKEDIYYPGMEVALKLLHPAAHFQQKSPLSGIARDILPEILSKEPNFFFLLAGCISSKTLKSISPVNLWLSGKDDVIE